MNGCISVIPTLFSDVNKRMEAWGNEGQLNPFDKINNLVFQVSPGRYLYTYDYSGI